MVMVNRLLTVGSSRMRIFGWWIKAIASESRLCCPPLSVRTCYQHQFLGRLFLYLRKFVIVFASFLASAQSSHLFNKHKFEDVCLILAPGDHPLEGGEVGEAFLVGSQPKSDWWLWQKNHWYNHLIPGHVEEPPKIGECFWDGELHEQAASISLSAIVNTSWWSWWWWPLTSPKNGSVSSSWS